MNGKVVYRGTTVLATALCGLLIATCGPGKQPPPPADTSIHCAERAECPKGFICTTDGICDQCGSDGQCRPREQCDPTDRVCTFRSGWGDACVLNAECPAGQMCVQGLCQDQTSVTLCPSGSCPQGFRCNKANLVCEEDLGCFGDADCAPTEVCNLKTTACEPRCTAATQNDVCQPGFRCAGSRCVECTQTLDCPPGLQCDVAAGRCGSSSDCFTNRDCQVPLVCNKGTHRCVQPSPPCTSNETCLPDERCDVPSGKCLKKACQPDRYEPNNQLSQATPILSGSFAQVFGLTLCDYEEDWYSLPLRRGDHVDVTVNADTLAALAFDTRLVDSTGRVLAYGNLAVGRTVSVDGLYYLRLSSSDATAAYGLTIIVSRGVPCDDDRFEPNDDTAHATPIHAAGEYDFLTICGPDVDIFAVDVPAGKGISLSETSIATQGLVDIYLFNGDGIAPLGSDISTNDVKTVSALANQIAGGRVYLKVVGDNPQVTNGYYLTVGYTP